MRQMPFFSWDEETGEATCVMPYKDGVVFYGLATCHPDDRDMMSEKTGCDIAYRRASIKALAYHRDTEVKPALGALKQLYFSMKHSQNFNEKSYENKMLQRQIRQLELDLATTKEMLVDARQSLNSLLQEKDLFYQRIRYNRKANIE